MSIDSVDAMLAAAKRAQAYGFAREAAGLYRQIAGFGELKENRALFFLLAASVNQDAHEFDQAIADCRSALAIDPDSSKAWRSLGCALIDAGQDAAAELALARSISLSESTTAYVFLGAVQLRANRFAEAEQSFRKALNLDPSFDEAHYCLGCALREQGRFVEAMGAFQTAIQISPDCDIAHRQLGRLYMREGNSIEAGRHFRKCLEISPDDEQAIELLSRLDGE